MTDTQTYGREPVLRLFLPLRRRIIQSTGGLAHTTVDLLGPDDQVLRMHIQAPRFSLYPRPSLLIINGYYRITLTPFQAILMEYFCEEMNATFKPGMEISEDALRSTLRRIAEKTHKLFPKMLDSSVKASLNKLMSAIIGIAKNGPIPPEVFSSVSHGDWLRVAPAPERMDLIVSKMIKNGQRNCPLNCGICYADDQPAMTEGRELSTFEWMQVIKKCKRIGVAQLTFTGGEPLKREDIVELVKEAEEFITRLNTSAVLLTYALAVQLREAELDNLQVTVYSKHAEVHNLAVGRPNTGAHAATVRGIKVAVKAGLNVSVNIPIVPGNIDHLGETVRWLIQDCGVQDITTSGVIPSGGGLNVPAFNEAELESALRAAVSVAKAYNVEVMFTSPGQLPEQVFIDLGIPEPMCGACASNAAITPSGYFVPCQSWLSKPKGLGNFLLKPWDWIWQSQECIDIREKHALKAKCALPR